MNPKKECNVLSLLKQKKSKNNKQSNARPKRHILSDQTFLSSSRIQAAGRHREMIPVVPIKQRFSDRRHGHEKEDAPPRLRDILRAPPRF